MGALLHEEMMAGSEMPGSIALSLHCVILGYLSPKAEGSEALAFIGRAKTASFNLLSESRERLSKPSKPSGRLLRFRQAFS